MRIETTAQSKDFLTLIVEKEPTELTRPSPKWETRLQAFMPENFFFCSLVFSPPRLREESTTKDSFSAKATMGVFFKKGQKRHMRVCQITT